MADIREVGGGKNSVKQEIDLDNSNVYLFLRTDGYEFYCDETKKEVYIRPISYHPGTIVIPTDVNLENLVQEIVRLHGLPGKQR